ncbi:MAG: hypothetical protein ACRDRJ_27785 [Streptosporangiaceae bacterium]
MTSRRQVSLDSVDATSIAVALSGIETWLRGAPDNVIASLAEYAYGEPTGHALSWARELISDLRYYSAVMSFAVRAADPEEQPPFRATVKQDRTSSFSIIFSSENGLTGTSGPSASAPRLASGSLSCPTGSPAARTPMPCRRSATGSAPELSRCSSSGG